MLLMLILDIWELAEMVSAAGACTCSWKLDGLQLKSFESPVYVMFVKRASQLRQAAFKIQDRWTTQEVGTKKTQRTRDVLAAESSTSRRTEKRRRVPFTNPHI